MQLWAVAILVSWSFTVIFLIASSHGLNDYTGRPLGTDFSSFYSAGSLMKNRHSPYDQEALHHTQQMLFGQKTPYYAFAYPPIFLFILEPLASFPYLIALALWQGTTFLFYLAAMRRLRETFARTRDNFYWALVIGFAAVFVNLTHGQNGFLSCGLFTMAFAYLDKRPWLAGLCFGLLIYKPQLGILIPFALAANGRWKSFAGAAATVAALATLSIAIYGIGAWHSFFLATSFSRVAILGHGAVGFEKMVSVFAWFRLWGLPTSLACSAQLISTLAAAGATIWLWRGNTSLVMKAALLGFATLLATPFALDYDLMILAPSIALIAFEGQWRGSLPYERTLVAALWLAPFVARVAAERLSLPLGILAVLFGFVFTVRTGFSTRSSARVFVAA